MIALITTVLFWLIAVLATLVAAAAFAVGVGRWVFARRADRELLELTASSDDYGPLVHADELDDLPPVVQRWLRLAGVVDRPRARLIELRQHGEMQLEPGKKWLPFRATQWTTTRHPGYVWVADVDAAPCLSIAGIDRYRDGRGRSRIELMSLIPLANAAGPYIDQASLVRYLAEIVWYPSAALEPQLFWKQLDETTAQVTICNGGIAASGVFRFDHIGNVVSFEAERYRDDTLETWYLEADPDGYARLGGMRLPLRWTVAWRRPEGDWTWLKLAVDDIRYDGDPLARVEPRGRKSGSTPASIRSTSARTMRFPNR